MAEMSKISKVARSMRKGIMASKVEIEKIECISRYAEEKA
jgi:hypothetical protein